MFICPRRYAPACLYLLLGVGMPLLAQSQTAGERLTLAQAIARAQASAPAIRAAGAAQRSADAAVNAASLAPNPTLTVEVENIMGTGRYARFTGAETTYSLSMPLELGGKRAARVRVAEAERAAGTVGASAVEADLTLRTARVFIAVAASERRVAVANTVLALAQRAEAAAQARVRAGNVSPIDEQRATVQRINAQVKADRAIRSAQAARAALARLLNAASVVAIAAPWFDDPDLSAPLENTATYLPLTAADAQVAVADARLDAARRGRVPDLTVNLGARRFKETGDSAAVVSVSIPLPIFNNGSAEFARARAELDKTRADRDAAAVDVAQALAETQAELADARASAAAANGPAIAAAAEVARIARIGYAEGKFSQLDLIEAERSLADTQESAIEALTALHEARARLARLQGRITPIYQN